MIQFVIFNDTYFWYYRSSIIDPFPLKSFTDCKRRENNQVMITFPCHSVEDISMVIYGKTFLVKQIELQ